LQRELLYTGITRAQKELFIICEPETLIQGVTSQHIVGNSLAEKAEYFKGKVAANKSRNDMFNKGEADAG
jgi:superfamily I DNA/RNA helicase